MSEQEQNKEKISSYRSIFKATSLFGGVQVYQIVIQIIKSKFIAILLGPSGVGIQGLLQSATDMMKQFTSCGLSQSAVRNVSESYVEGDHDRISKTISIVQRLVWITGLLGVVSVLLLSPVLSKMSFGNYTYTIPFLLLSVTLLLDQLCAGQKVVLQGTRRLLSLAKSSAYGVTIGLITSVPLFYFFGLDGIVPALIINSFTMLALTSFYSKKIEFTKYKIDFKQAFQEGKGMLIMGIALSVSAILTSASTYLLRGYIRDLGGTEEVGLYTAGFAIVNSYVGMVFTAMGTDFYPRLSAINKDNAKCIRIVNEQSEIGTLIIAPLIALCILFMPIIVKILYSSEFMPANNYISWAVLGMLFKMLSWAIAFMFVAKGESKLFMINEATSCIYSLLLNILFYKSYGLTGLGMSFTISYFLYVCQVFIIAIYRYNFSFSSSLLKIFFQQMAIILATFSCFLCVPSYYKYIFGMALIILSISISFIGLQKRMNIFTLVKKHGK